MTNVYHRDARNILVRKDLLSSSPTPVSTQGELQQVTQDHSQSGFDHLQGWRLKNLSTHFMLCLVNLTVNKKCFCFAWLVLILIMIFFLNLHPLSLVLHRAEECGSLISTVSLQLFIHLDKILETSLIQVEKSQLIGHDAPALLVMNVISCFLNYSNNSVQLFKNIVFLVTTQQNSQNHKRHRTSAEKANIAATEA